MNIYLIAGLTILVPFLSNTLSAHDREGPMIDYSETLLRDSTLLFADASEQVIAGHLIFSTRCQNCHSTVVSHYLSVDDWISTIDVMAPGAGLDSTSTSHVKEYVKWTLARTDSSIVIPVYGMNQW